MRTCGQSFGASTNASALMNWKRSGSFLAMLLHFIVIGWPGHMRFSIRWARKSSGTNWGRMLTHLKTITTPSNIRWQGNTCSVSTTGWQMVLCLRRAVLLEMCIRWRLEKLLPLARENIWGNRWRFEQGYQGVIIVWYQGAYDCIRRFTFILWPPRLSDHVGYSLSQSPIILHFRLEIKNNDDDVFMMSMTNLLLIGLWWSGAAPTVHKLMIKCQWISIFESIDLNPCLTMTRDGHKVSEKYHGTCVWDETSHKWIFLALPGVIKKLALLCLVSLISPH